MSLNSKIVGLLLASICGCSIHPAAAAGVCPVRHGNPLRFVDIFDGAPEQLATLIPDKSEKQSGYWVLDYIFNAGRFVVVRCKYDGNQTFDVKLSSPVHKCEYTIDATKTLRVYCK